MYAGFARRLAPDPTLHAMRRMHAWWAGPDHPPGLLHRSDERSESRGSKPKGGTAWGALPMQMSSGSRIAPGWTAISAAMERQSSRMGRALRGRRGVGGYACGSCLVRWGAVPLALAAKLRRRLLGVASYAPPPLGLAAPRAGQSGLCLRLSRIARSGSVVGWCPPRPPLWALILGGVRRGAPCGGPKSALRTPPAVQGPGGVGGLRPLA